MNKEQYVAERKVLTNRLSALKDSMLKVADDHTETDLFLNYLNNFQAVAECIGMLDEKWFQVSKGS